MPGRRNPLSPLILLLWSALPAAAQNTDILSPRNANYTIEARLDPVQKTLEGKEVLRWRNDAPLPAHELWFHLYWNAWKNNQSTWLKEASLNSRWSGREEGEKSAGDWSYCSVKSMRVLSSGIFPESVLTPRLRYAAPDDGNTSDQTVMAATLSRAVGPGETIEVEVIWNSKIPRTFARTGFRGNYFFIAQWFPKLGVYQADGTWNCHQFHAATEFFSDYGVYDVKLTVPRGWLLGATGRQQAVRDNPDGTSTHHYYQEDVHDFAWTTSPDYREAGNLFQFPGLKPVQMRLLYQPEHESQVGRHFQATEAALHYYGLWYGVYPYGHITVVDPAWRSGSGGMEYPTLFTCGTRILNPGGGGDPEGVTVHEAGHQFWYGIVGNNEFEDAWLDEGLNTFSTSRAMEAAFGETAYVQRFFHGFIPFILRDVRERRMTGGNHLDGYRSAARFDIEATPTYRYFPETASNITYSKTAIWLSTLEKMLGWETFGKVLSTFFERWKFRHPKPNDFFSVANEIAGRDLTGFFDQVYRKEAVFDFAVESVSSDEVRTEGFVDKNDQPTYTKGEASGGRFYRTNAVFRRLQDGILPVDVLLKFESGEEVRDVWDARSPWKLYSVVKPSRLSYAAIDPERRIVLDINYTNNSRLLTSQSGFAASKWASKWMIWLQDYFQTLAFLF